MDDTEFWYYVRTRIRTISIEQRRTWTRDDLHNWWETRKRVNNLPPRKQGRPIPDIELVDRMCSDLYGRGAQ